MDDKIIRTFHITTEQSALLDRIVFEFKNRGIYTANSSFAMRAILEFFQIDWIQEEDFIDIARQLAKNEYFSRYGKVKGFRRCKIESKN